MASPTNPQENSPEQEPDVKAICVVIDGSGQEPKLINLMPGVTPLDVFECLDLKGYRMEKSGGSYFASDEDLYNAVENCFCS